MHEQSLAEAEADLVQRIRELSQPIEPLPTDLPERSDRLAGIRAVVFDVYGTLFVSGSGDVGTARKQARGDFLFEALEDCDLDPRPGAGDRGVELLIEEIKRRHEELRDSGIEHPEVEIRDIWARVGSRLGDEQLVAGAVEPARAARLAVEYECRVNPAWPMPGMAEVLANLRGPGLHLGIVSNAQFFTPLLFAALAGQGTVKLGFADRSCIWSYRLSEAKPSAGPYRLIRDRLQDEQGIEAANVLYVGNDMLNDVVPARSVGFHTALFAGDARSLRLRENEAACRGVEPTIVIKELRSLPRILGLA